MMKNIPYGKQTISEKDTKNVLKTIRSEFLTTGPTTKIFEEKFSERVGSKFAISCSSGTSALHLCFMSINLKKNELDTGKRKKIKGALEKRSFCKSNCKHVRGHNKKCCDW